MNTRDKRASVLGFALAATLVLPSPDGAALNQGDRQQTAYAYRGIAADNPGHPIALTTSTARWDVVLDTSTASYQAVLSTSIAEWGT